MILMPFLNWFYPSHTHNGVVGGAVTMGKIK